MRPSELKENESILRVVAHVSGDQFQDYGDCPTFEDDQHVFYLAIVDGEGWRGTSHEEYADAIISGELSPYVDNFYILSRPEPDARLRLAAIKRYYELA